MSRDEQPPSQTAREFGTTLALLIALLIAGGLFALVTLVFPHVQGLLIVGLIFILPALFHYFVWGRAMSRMRDRILAEEARQAAAANPPRTRRDSAGRAAGGGTEADR